MTLSDFIEANLDILIKDWMDYARIVGPKGCRMTDEQLRDSARDLLVGIAANIREPQDAGQQIAKSRGEWIAPDPAFDEVGRTHADDRQTHGFDINAVVAEYRALRASVLYRWQQGCEADATAFQEMVRFNEAIDQMVAESVRQFTRRTERIRDLFAGVLAHDMRSPLTAIVNSAHLLLRDENLSSVSLRAGINLQRGTERIRSLVDDLFIFTRTRLGDTLPVEPTEQDFGRICVGAVEEVRAARPGAQIELSATGSLAGTWDGQRMSQLIVNLLTNAVQYGSNKVRLKAVGDDDSITLVVSNEGPPIPADVLPTLFDPLTRAVSPSATKRLSAGVGLGLYICQCIAHAHQGTISVESSERETAFTLKIPRFRP
ncbi:Signal transduction histidine kinase [Paraburkholderia fungorum]|uniref:histidine kinase n=1 Tax=Paraburkholderia fungorum TaxID=134537 RepID=A0A1H1JWJ1_9BURK|nr:sensor histidine kinase [Paraburkholderia fungorum]SDR54109.1 Signal transduction histidine kinase [Paraburkholderia fungorum]